MSEIFRGLQLSICLILAACGGSAVEATSPGSPAPVELKVISSNLEGPNVAANTDAVISIGLNQDIKSSVNLLQFGELIGPDGVVPLQAASAVGSRITFTPSLPLNIKSEYSFTLKRGVPANSGVVLGGDYKFTFKTVAIKFSGQVIIPPPARSVFGSVHPLVAVGDLNGDGRPDIVSIVGLLNAPDPSSEGYSLIIYHQNGAGGFEQVQRFNTILEAGPSAAYIESLLVLDVDGDGVPEIVVSERRAAEERLTGLRVYKRGVGGVYSASSFFQTQYVRELKVADVDGDGKAELIGCYFENYTAGLQVFRLGNGFEALASLDLPAAATEFDVGDINGDGLIDIMIVQMWPYITNMPGSPVVTVYTLKSGAVLQKDDLMSARAAETCKGAMICEEAVLIDVNGDGKLDIVYGSWMDSTNSDAAIFLQKSDGSFVSESKPSFGMGRNLLFARDMDRDGHQDLVIINNTALGVGVGQMQSALRYSPVFDIPVFDTIYAGSAVIADINGDGLLDVVAASDNSGVALMLQTQH